MQRLLFLSSISLAAALTGCSGDDSCGPGNAAPNGLQTGDQDQTLTFGNLVSSANNDCRDSSVPDIISLTIGGTQTNGTGLLTLCIPRPDKLGEGVMLGGTGAPLPEVQIVDLNGTANGCDYTFESTRPVAGTVSATGVCGNGTDKAGYALAISGHISLKRTCPTATDTIAVNFNGTAAVAVH